MPNILLSKVLLPNTATDSELDEIIKKEILGECRYLDHWLHFLRPYWYRHRNSQRESQILQ